MRERIVWVSIASVGLDYRDISHTDFRIVSEYNYLVNGALSLIV